MTDGDDWAADLYAKRLAEVARRLRNLADTVEREGAARQGDIRVGGAYPHPDWIRAAERAIHEVSWGVANLNLSELVNAATEAHENARKTVD